MKPFTWEVRVYFEDTDSGGVVYYANYLKFMERARTEFLRSLGIDQDALMASDQLIFAVRAISVDYLKPAKFNQMLEVSAVIVHRGKVSLTFEQHITRDMESKISCKRESQVICKGRVKIASIDTVTMRPKPIPSHLFAEIPQA